MRLAILADLRLAGWVHQESEQEQIRALLESRQLYSGFWEPQMRDKVREGVEAIYREYRNREDGWQLAIKTWLNEILLLICRNAPLREKKTPSREVAKVRSILEYAARNYCSDISLDQCAAAVGFNPSYLSRYFHAHMGNEALQVTEVAYACGFRDIKTFNKLFKKECGMSPTQYRKNVKICVV